MIRTRTIVGTIIKLGVMVFSCNPATLKAEFWNGADAITVGDNSHSLGGWIV